MRFLLLSIVISFPSISLAQKKTYYDYYWNKVKSSKESTYYRTIEKLGQKFMVRDYVTATDQLKQESVCSQTEPQLVYDGVVKVYRPNKNLEVVGNFSNGKKDGLYYSFTESGDSVSIKFYRAGSNEERTVQLWDDTNKSILINGTGTYQSTMETGEQYTAHYRDSLIREAYAVSSSSADTVFLVTDQAATFVGGMKLFYQQISKELRYPEQAVENELEGTVYIQFDITPEGKTVNVLVRKGIGSGCNEEAIRVFTKINEQAQWEPAVHKGRPVKSRLILPVSFRLQ